MSKENPIPFYQHLDAFAENPCSALSDDVKKMAEELIEAFELLSGWLDGSKIDGNDVHVAAWVARMEEMS